MATAFLYNVLLDKWIRPGNVVTESFAGRAVIVTGANSGVGFEVACKFAELGASNVILAVRDLEKGEAAKAAIEARTGRKNQLDIWQLDMNSYDSIIAFAKRAESLPNLGAAILNAGVRKAKFVQSKHGWEEDLQVHVLSSILLGILLLSTLKASKLQTGRIPALVFVNSGLVKNTTIPSEVIRTSNLLEAYNAAENFRPGTQYPITKLFLMYATNTLAERVSSGDVIITSTCPGFSRTNMGRDAQFPGIDIILAILAVTLMRTAEQGARHIVSATTVGERVHGRFWKNDIVQPVPASIAGEENKKIALRVWNEVVDALQKDVPSIKNVLQAAASRK